MALLFDDASTQYLSYAGAILTATPMSMSALVYKDDGAVGGIMLSIGNSLTAARFQLQYDANEDVDCTATSVAGGNNPATSSGAGGNDVWLHAGGVWASATSRTAYRDGGNKGTNAVSTIPLLCDRTFIGAKADSAGPGTYMSGGLAEIALWDIDLTDAEMTILSQFVSPICVRPGNLVAYWRLVDATSPAIDIVGGYHMTFNGSPTKMAHPRVFYPAPKTYVYAKTAVAGQPTWKRLGGTPWAGGRLAAPTQVWSKAA